MAISQSDEYILLGKISGVHGIKGWIKVFSYTSPRVQIVEYERWNIRKTGHDWKQYNLREGKEQGKNIIAKLEGVNYRDEAEALRGMEIAVHQDQLAILKKDEYYWKDLIGVSVETINGEKLGIIDWLFDTGSNDVIIVKQVDIEGGNEPKEHLLPFLFDDVIKSINLEQSLMIVDWDPDF